MKFIDRRFLWQLFLYFLVSGTATIINITVRILINNVTGYGASIVIAYISGFLFNFLFSKRFVFKGDKERKDPGQLLYFSLVACAGLAATYFVALFILSLLDGSKVASDEWNKTIAHTVGLGFSFLLNFIGNKFITFKLKDQVEPA